MHPCHLAVAAVTQGEPKVKVKVKESSSDSLVAHAARRSRVATAAAAATAGTHVRAATSAAVGAMASARAAVVRLRFAAEMEEAGGGGGGQGGNEPKEVEEEQEEEEEEESSRPMRLSLAFEEVSRATLGSDEAHGLGPYFTEALPHPRRCGRKGRLLRLFLSCDDATFPCAPSAPILLVAGCRRSAAAEHPCRRRRRRRSATRGWRQCQGRQWHPPPSSHDSSTGFVGSYRLLLFLFRRFLR